MKPVGEKVQQARPQARFLLCSTDVAAKYLGTSVVALVALLRRNVKVVDGEPRADLGNNIVGLKLGRRWKVRIPVALVRAESDCRSAEVEREGEST